MNGSKKAASGLVGLFIFLVFLGAIVFNVVAAAHVDHRTCTVESKDRTSDGRGKSDARVYTTDCGTLRVGDSLFAGTWHSSDTYASIKADQRYEFTTRGFRVPLFSMFPNIVEADPV